MLGNQRDHFDVPDNITYLNCAAYSPLMNRVREAGLEGLDRKFHPWNLDLTETPGEAERARTLFAELISAESDDIAIVGSGLYGAENIKKRYLSLINEK